MMTNTSGGSYYYPKELNSTCDLLEVSNVTYMEKKLYCWLPSLINHCFVSFEGFSVSYNETITVKRLKEISIQALS